MRTRLTHSLEVANVARGIASAVAQWLSESGELSDPSHRDAIPVIASTCGLIHDVGNPPFGHSGEESIRTWFTDRRDRLTKFFGSFARVERGDYQNQLERDFLNFEGNAQTIRIVSKLQVLADYYGLNLTAGTLSAALKYTASSDQADTNSSVHEKRKPGFFASENKLIDRVREVTGTGDSRNPITFLAEAADDIVYSVVDLEDGVKKGAIGWGEVESRLKHASSGDDGLLGEILDKSGEYVRRAEPKLEWRDHDEAMSQVFRTYAIVRFTSAAVAAFKKNYRSIMNGEFHGELIKESDVAKIVKACKDTAKECIFQRDPTILDLNQA